MGGGGVTIVRGISVDVEEREDVSEDGDACSTVNVGVLAELLLLFC